MALEKALDGSVEVPDCDEQENSPTYAWPYSKTPDKLTARFGIVMLQ